MVEPVAHHQFLLLEIMFVQACLHFLLAAGQARAVGSIESGNLVVYGPLKWPTTLPKHPMKV